MCAQVHGLSNQAHGRMNMKKQSNVSVELALLILLTIGGIYIFAINYIAQPASWREWYLRQVPPELAVLNLLVLIALSFAITLYSRYLPLAVQFLFILGIIFLGSFLRLSIEVAPSIGVPTILASVVLYIILRQKRNRAKDAIPPVG